MHTLVNVVKVYGLNNKLNILIMKGMHNKVYLVSDGGFHDTFDYAKLHFKTAAENIHMQCGWILNDQLFLHDPHDQKATKHWIASERKE